MAQEIDAGELAMMHEMEEEASSGGASRKRKFSDAFPRKWFEDHELDLELSRR